MIPIKIICEAHERCILRISPMVDEIVYHLEPFNFSASIYRFLRANSRNEEASLWYSKDWGTPTTTAIFELIKELEKMKLVNKV